MKVKFYKGPYHGKTRDIRDEEVRRGITIHVSDPKSDVNRYLAAFRVPHGQYAHLAPTYKVARYSVRMMTFTAYDGTKYMAPAMHPDGSIFMVHEGTK